MTVCPFTSELGFMHTKEANTTWTYASGVCRAGVSFACN
jgi:hypothetical protein